MVVCLKSENVIGPVIDCSLNNSLQLARKYARIFVRGHYLFRVRTVFRERSSKKTDSHEDIVSKDKYPRTFSRKMEPIVFIFIRQRFFVTRAVLKVWDYHSDIP